MNENDAMRLLAQANPVRTEDLGSTSPPDLERRRRPARRRIVLAIAAIAIGVGATAAIAVVAPSNSSPGQTISKGPTRDEGPTGPAGPPPATVARPLLSGTRVTLAEAAAAIGQRVVLPDAALVGPRDVGPVWAWSHDVRGIVAVTYPAQRLWVTYEQPAPYADPLSGLTALSKDLEGSDVIRVGRVPALFIRGNDGTGNNDVMFEVNALLITVRGPYGEAKLQAVARSIVERSPSTVSRPGLNLVPITPSRKPVALRKVSRRLGARILLPGLRLLKRSEAGVGWQEGACPPSGRKACMIWLPFPGESVSIVYQRGKTSPFPRTRRQYELEAKKVRVSRVVELDGVPAWEIRPNVDHHNPGLIYFAVGGTRVIVSGHRTTAWLEAVARSMVARSK